MPIISTTPVRPGQNGGTGAVDALHIEEYTNELHGTIDRKSVLAPWVPTRTVQGTSVLQSYAVGETALQKLVPGEAPDGTAAKFGKNNLTIDTVILGRNIVPLLDDFQTKYDARAAIGREHGKKHAKFKDQAFFIQAIKAGLLTDTKYTGVSGAGHSGGNKVTMNASADASDPALMYDYLGQLMVKFQNKDIDPADEDMIITVRPELFMTLLQNEWLVNTNYVTSAGTSVDAMVLKTYGVPVISSTNFMGGQNVTGHYLSNAANGNAYDGDFTKVVAGVFSPMALMAGETIPLTTNVWFNDLDKQWYIDSWTSFGVGPDRAEYAGLIVAP